MSSVGFVDNAGQDAELAKLREAYDSLKDIMRAIESAKSCMELMNFGLAKDHLTAATWHAKQAKKAIALCGQAKNQKAGK